MADIVFLGLDGATWDVIDPLIDDGRLPTIERLTDQGTRGKLASTHPPVTYPAWRVLSSGKNPGKLGVYGWNRPDFEDRRFVYASSTDYRTRDVWDYLNAAGLTTAVVNQPGTYPPFEVDGVFISGPESQGDDIVRPRTRRDLLDRFIPHTHGLANRVAAQDLPRALKVIETNMQVATELGKEVDVLHHVVFLTDTVQHHLWDHPEALAETWETVDRCLGEMLDELDPETAVLASDHGFQTLDLKINVNAMLAEAGLATLSMPSGAGLLDGLGINRDNVLKLAGKLGITEQTLAKLPDVLKDRVPEKGGKLQTRRAAGVDWEHTVALTGDGRGVHLADPSRLDEVRELLEEATDPDGQALFTAVRPAKEVWHGPHLDRAPDLLITPRHGVEPGGSIGDDVFQTPVPGEGWIAHHHPDGILLAWGEGVRQGRLEGARIEDVMPTILAAAEAAIPDDVDGKVLDVFTDPPSIEERAPLAVGQAEELSEEDMAKVEDRLKGLGYLD